MNRRSKQSDVVLYDKHRCPRLLVSDEHSVYPCESVYGTIEVKSDLTSDQLRDGFEKVASVKKMISGSFQFIGAGGALAVGFRRPMPFGGIFAFTSTRSLEAVWKQAKELDREFGPRLAPDAIIVLDRGVVSRGSPVRGNFNSLSDESFAEDLTLASAGKHSLLGFYLQMVRELNTLELEPLDLERYLRMPIVIGPYRVWGGGPYLRAQADGSGTPVATRLAPKAIEKILGATRDQPTIRYEDAFAAFLGKPVKFMGAPQSTLDQPVRVYNPLDRHAPETMFVHIRVDELPLLLVDLGALDPNDDFVVDPDVDLEEAFGVKINKGGSA
jgi:hypothetical protein